MKNTTYILEITTQKYEKYLSERRNPLACLPACLITSCQLRNFLREFSEKCFAVLSYQAARFISRGIGRSYFSRNFLLWFLTWYYFRILVKPRRGGTFLCLASSVNVLQKHFFFIWRLNIPPFIFLTCTKQFWIWFCRKLKKTSKFSSLIKVFLILPPVWLSNLRSDLSVGNIVQLGLADTKIGSQDAVMKVLGLTEKWKYPNFRGKF